MHQEDAANTGLVDHNQLGQWCARAYDKGWYAGIMYWQYASDLNGDAIKASAGYLKEQCSVKKNCN